jgi:hypothetical protein
MMMSTVVDKYCTWGRGGVVFGGSGGAILRARIGQLALEISHTRVALLNQLSQLTPGREKDHRRKSESQQK